jgi:Prolyl oligopeptidase family
MRSDRATSARCGAFAVGTLALALFLPSIADAHRDLHASQSCGDPGFTRERHVPQWRHEFEERAQALRSLPWNIPRPGPDVLYWPLARSPQLENTGPWGAEPILISGASAYRDGEFLYQDFLYDDTGADGSPQSPGAGTYTYPGNVAYAGNAADLLEVRIKPLARGTAFRISYNTMLDPELVASTIVLGDAAGVRPLPYGANLQAPAEVFVTVHGSTGSIIDAATGRPIAGVDLSVAVDRKRRQVHVCVPYRAFDPRGDSAVRVAVGTGLWNAATNAYLTPQATATDSVPGGAGSLTAPPAFFNVAFRYTEPLSGFANTQQGATLSSGDLSAFSASVDFRKLAKGIDDDMPGKVGGVPQTGYMNRILVSHFEQAQGRGSATTLQPDLCPAGGCEAPTNAGRLQPYEIYVPARRPGPAGYGLMVNPHAAGGNQNNYPSFASQWQIQIGERDAPYISMTPNGRGTAYWYFGQGGADVFEVWADIAHRYNLDPSRTMLGGLSMGGYATLKLGGQFPDLFAATPSIVACPSAGTRWLEGQPPPGGEASVVRHLAPAFRNVPTYMWVGTVDTTCSYWAQVEYAHTLDELGYRYRFYSFIGLGHAWLLGNEFGPMIEWMDDRQVVRDPHHITYVLNGMMNEPAVGLNADHVYWLGGLKLRDTSVSPPIGTIDVVSHGFGVGDPAPNPTVSDAGEFVGTNGPVSVTSQARDWGDTPRTPVRNAIDIRAVNVSAVTIYPLRARVNCNAKINVDSDGPIDVTLAGCPRHVHHPGPGHH